MVNEESSQGTREVSADTDSRTKTVQFSHNVDSDEVVMNSSKLKKSTTDLGAAVLNLDEEEESPREPPGFEKRGINQRCNAIRMATIDHEVSKTNGHGTQATEL